MSACALPAIDASAWWATGGLSGAGLLLVAVTVGAGVALVLLLLCGTEDEPEPPDADGTEAERAAVAAARARLEAALREAPPALRAAVDPLLAGPLLDLDRRLKRLAATARTHGSDAHADEVRRLGLELARIDQELEGEPDEEARELLAATRREVATALEGRAELTRRGRLAELELRQLRALIDSLVSRVRAAAARGLAEADVAHVARELERALEDASAVLAAGAPAAATDPSPRAEETPLSDRSDAAVLAAGAPDAATDPTPRTEETP